MSQQLLVPPDVFGPIEPGLYRSTALIEPLNVPFLRTLGLKTIVLLSAEPPSRALVSFTEEAGIKLNHLGAKHAQPITSKSATANTTALGASWKPLPDEAVKEGIEFVLNSTNHPCLICCTSGIHETGAFVGCLRKYLGWNFNSIVVEYRCFAGSKSRYLIGQFIELFDVDLVTLPRDVSVLPFWFVEFQRVVAEDEEERAFLQS